MDLYTIREELNKGVPLTHLPLRVTDYARVSTDSIKQQKSLQNQVEHFKEYIKSNPHWIYIKGYADDGITGTSDIKRENFMQMIEDARKGMFDLIITKEISRFSRNTLDSIKYTRELLSYGVAVLFVQDNINTALPDAELRLTIMASMAQDEIRRLSERVKFGMRRAIEKGEILGNDQLFGYKKEKERGNLKIIEEEAMIVRNIFELYAIEEYSLTKIKELLNQKEIKTSQGKKWSITGISRMIENPKYKGYYCAKKSEVMDYMTKKVKYFSKKDWILYQDKEKIPPIIKEELWERANKRLQSRKKSCKKREEKTIYQDRFILSAKLYCQEHKTLFHKRIFRKGKKESTWICSEYLKKGKKFCDSPNIRESEILFILNDVIQKLQMDTNKIKQILISYYKNIVIEKEKKEELRKRNKEIESLMAKKDKLLELSLKEMITNEEFVERNNILNQNIKKAKEEISRFKKIITNKKDFYEVLEKEIEKKIHSSHTSNKIIKLLLHHIIVEKQNEGKNNIILHIYLNSNTIKNAQKKDPILIKNYEFKRGYDTKGTKRYIIKYTVKCYTDPKKVL